jgi:hypothetical protein
MSLFDRYFLVLAGRVPESEAGVVASNAMQSGVLTLSWPLDEPTADAITETNGRAGQSGGLCRVPSGCKWGC